MSLATVILLLSLIVPHHHHGRQTCFMIEECNGHESNPIGHDVEDEELCAVKGNFLTSKSNYDNALVLIKYNHPVYLNFFVFYYHHIDLIDFLGSKRLYKPYISPDKSILYSFFKGLRSPPSYLV